MIICAVEKLKPGMEVGADILNMNGVLLMPKGAVFTDKQIRLLKTWGVETVSIASAPDQAPAPKDVLVTAEVLDKARERVEQRFRFVKCDAPVIRAIKEIATTRAAQRSVSDADAPNKNTPV